MNNERIARELLRIAKDITADYTVDDTPRVYVGTYAKYNDGNIDGKWVDLTDYDNYEDFIEYCKQLHSDEEDPEFMFQDYENFPKKYYGESELKPQLWDYIEKINEQDKQKVDTLIEWGFDLDEVDDFSFYEDCNNEGDFARAYIDETGGIENLEQQKLIDYFNYNAYGRDLSINSTLINYKNGYLFKQ